MKTTPAIKPAPLFPVPGGRPRPPGRVFFAIVALALNSAALAGPWWVQYARDASRSATTDRGPSSIASPAWIFSTDAQGRAVQFVGQSSPVVTRDLVLAVGSVVVNSQRQYRLFAIDRRTGLQAWAAPILSTYVDSWSSPAVDLDHNTAIVASGNTVGAFALADGHTVWQRPLTRNVVNASPLVTSRMNGEGLGLANRVFITEYDGFGAAGRLTCINTDVRFGTLNPYDPGQLVWSVEIGASSGNTCALWRDTVFVACIGADGFSPGRILAFPARATTAPTPLWVFENPAFDGFFGGLCITEENGNPWLFAASYGFFGGTSSGQLIKLDALTGNRAWSTPCNRTASIPFCLNDGRILLSAGVNGFGTVPNLQLFRDNGADATLLWDSAANTWTDTDDDGAMDLGEYFYLGGWTHQPVVASRQSQRVLYCGVPPTSANSFGPGTSLYTLDVAELPTQPGNAGPDLILVQFIGAGSSPAIADENLYTIGATGLFAFGPTPFRYDVNLDGAVDIEDLYAWEQGTGSRDVDLNGAVALADRDALEKELRRYEQGAGRP